MKLTQEILKAIPEENWMIFLKEKYGHECGGIDNFSIGKNADNGFLTFETFCDILNQTTCDVTEEEFLLIQSGTYENKYKKIIKEDVIRQHFHEFTDEQWKDLKDSFPYSKIPYIIDHVILNLIKANPEIPNRSKILKDNYYKDKNI